MMIARGIEFNGIFLILKVKFGDYILRAMFHTYENPKTKRATLQQKRS